MSKGLPNPHIGYFNKSKFKIPIQQVPVIIVSITKIHIIFPNGARLFEIMCLQ